MKLKGLLEREVEIKTELRSMLGVLEKEEKPRDFNDEERKAYDALHAELGTVKRSIELLKFGEELDGEDKRSKFNPGRQPAEGDPSGGDQVTDEHRDLALNAWMVRNNPKPRSLTDDEIEACKRVGINPNDKEFVFKLRSASDVKKMRREGWEGGHGRSFIGAERRALSAEFGATGGFTTASSSMVNAIEVNMLHYGGILQACDLIRTSTGETMVWPTVDDTSNTGYQIGENVQVSPSSQPSFGATRLDVYDFASGAILIPYRLMRDSAFDLASLTGQMLGERLGRIFNTKGTVGTGAATPYGIVNRASSGITAASATAIAWSEVTRLIHSVDVAYRKGAAFMFHDGIYLALRQLTDGMGRPLWADGPNSTPPADLQGYPYFINNDMQSTVATGTTTMLFGQLKAHKCRQVNEIRLKRLDERYADYDQTGFMAFMSFGSNLVDPGTHPVKKLVQA